MISCRFCPLLVTWLHYRLFKAKQLLWECLTYIFTLQININRVSFKRRMKGRSTIYCVLLWGSGQAQSLRNGVSFPLSGGWWRSFTCRDTPDANPTGFSTAGSWSQSLSCPNPFIRTSEGSDWLSMQMFHCSWCSSAQTVSSTGFSLVFHICITYQFYTHLKQLWESYP